MFYDRDRIHDLVAYISTHDGIGDKKALSLSVKAAFGLRRDGSVFSCDWFAIRFCSSKGAAFGNTVLALSRLQKYDDVPFIVCLVMPHKNVMMLANTTFLKKISHSSKDLRIDNIKGSFNGSDIMRSFEGIVNEPCNFEYLFVTHQNFTFDENLQRLVEATNNIHPIGKRFEPTAEQRDCILRSVERTESFMCSADFDTLNSDLRSRVSMVASEIAIAAFIDNVNLRGRIIEYLITSPDDLKATLIEALRDHKPLPEIYTADKLGDYGRSFRDYDTETDIKTKVLFLSSNPKGYNLDKLLTFLAHEKSVYLLYIVAINANKQIYTRLCSMYHRQILNGTRIIGHWAGRNSRGVSQYDGTSLEEAVFQFDNTIETDKAISFMQSCIDL